MTFDGRRATLTIPEAFPKDAGSYVIVAKNEAGESSCQCHVSVKVGLRSSCQYCVSVKVGGPVIVLVSRLVCQGRRVGYRVSVTSLSMYLQGRVNDID